MLRDEADIYLDTVGDFDEGNAAIHPVVLTVESRVPWIAPEPVPLPETVSVSVSGLVTPRIVKSPCTSKVSGPVCTTFFDRHVINGLCFTSKKSLPCSFAVFHAAPDIHAVCLNLDV